VGGLHGSLFGRATIEAGQLVLTGRDSYVSTPPLDRDLTEKTLEVWLRLTKLDQRGGAAIGVQKLDGSVFDALVFGEQEPGRWIAGSDHFRRTKSFDGASEELPAKGEFTHFAIVYRASGEIAAYRDGVPYGHPYSSDGPVKFEAGKAQVMFGLRHSPPLRAKFCRAGSASELLHALSAEEVAASAGSLANFVSDAELTAQLDALGQARRQQLQAEILRLDEQLKTYRERQVYAVTPQAAPVMHLLVRGNVNQPAEATPPGGISSLAASRPDFDLANDASDADRRRKLAEWIASERNPLFARTIVNRVWQHHFGRGLVETPSDLGFSGGLASHPELLDWLASELIANKWSLKALHRLIVTSATYQQASRPRDECLTVVRTIACCGVIVRGG
jgi:hypothetical protein